MSQSIKKIIKQISFVVIASVVGVSIASAAGSWTAPPSSPPDGNVDAPLNVGGANQGKLGRLAIGTNDVNLLSSFAMYVNGLVFSKGQTINGGLILNDGNQGRGKILANNAALDPNGTLGAVTWVSIIGSLINSATGLIYWSEYENDGGASNERAKLYKCHSTSGTGVCSGVVVNVYGSPEADSSGNPGRLSRIFVSCSDNNPVFQILARSKSGPVMLSPSSNGQGGYINPAGAWWEKQYVGLCMSGTPAGFAASSHWSQ